MKDLVIIYGNYLMSIIGTGNYDFCHIQISPTNREGHISTKLLDDWHKGGCLGISHLESVNETITLDHTEDWSLCFSGTSLWTR